MKRDRIKDILAGGPLGQTLTVGGWVRSLRQSPNVGFIDLSDGSTLAGLQIVASPETKGFEHLAEFQTGAALRAVGELVESPAQGQKYELRAVSLELLGPADPETYPIQKKKHTLEFLRQKAHLRARTNTFGAVFRLRSHLSQGIHDFFRRKGFLYIHTPLISASDCEGAGELFHVSSTKHKDFFGRQAYLTVSGQLEAELLAL
ncbi:asparagine--tRNA ligase, partial [bacterium]|nr:asparagine--tRNA ligase [bacterium]